VKPVVTLIRPPSVVSKYALTLNATPPLSLAYVAASLVRAGYDVQVIDAVGEGLDTMRAGYRDDVLLHGVPIDQVVASVDPRALVVGISCMFSNEWPVVRSLIGMLHERTPNRPIVCGGEHPSAVPEFSLRTAPALTACVLGEGEETAVELFDALRAKRSLGDVAGIATRDEGKFLRTPRRARIRAVEDIPQPRWDLVPLESYLSRGLSFGVDRGRTIPMLATRGCPYRCTFCSSPEMWTTRYAARSPEDVVREMEHWIDRYEIDAVDFYDLTAIVHKPWIVALCRLLAQRGLAITWQLPSGTRSEALDADVLAHMFATGCRNVSYAPESGSERTLERIKKKVSLDRMLASMASAVGVGLNVKANIIMGFPDETAADLNDTLGFVARMARAGVHDVSVWTFSPYPGCELFDELVRRGRIGEMTDDYFANLLSYSDFTQTVSYSDALTGEQLRRYRTAAMALFYGLSYAGHPTRPFRSIKNMLQARYESRMEMSLGNLLRRLHRSHNLVQDDQAGTPWSSSVP
jgi:anaerobic magnesium-protoporphyrin IX monomethyl ester cyclase